MADELTGRVEDQKLVRLLAARSRANEKRIEVLTRLRATKLELQKATLALAKTETALGEAGFNIDRHSSLALW